MAHDQSYVCSETGFKVATPGLRAVAEMSSIIPYLASSPSRLLRGQVDPCHEGQGGTFAHGCESAFRVYICLYLLGHLACFTCWACGCTGGEKVGQTCWALLDAPNGPLLDAPSCLDGRLYQRRALINDKEMMKIIAGEPTPALTPTFHSTVPSHKTTV